LLYIIMENIFFVKYAQHDFTKSDAGIKTGVLAKVS
jgi:hypothetical protein